MDNIVNLPTFWNVTTRLMHKEHEFKVTRVPNSYFGAPKSDKRVGLVVTLMTGPRKGRTVSTGGQDAGNVDALAKLARDLADTLLE